MRDMLIFFRDLTEVFFEQLRGMSHVIAWTPIRRMRYGRLKCELRTQMVSFYMTMFNVCTMSAWLNLRLYFDLVGDHQEDRRFVLRTVVLMPICGLCWFVSSLLMLSSLEGCRRITWYGLVAVVVNAIPAILAALMAFAGYYELVRTLAN